MKSSIAALDTLFDFSHSRKEAPRWLCNQGLRAFVVSQPPAESPQPLIVTEREHVINFSTRWLSMADLDNKTRYRLCEYALIRNRSPYDVTFLASDCGLTALWRCYRTLISADMENNLVHYMVAIKQLSRYIGRPERLFALLTEDGLFQNE